MSDPKKALLQAIENSRKVQGIQEELTQEERRPKTPPVEAETDQSSRPLEEPPNGSDDEEPSVPS